MLGRDARDAELACAVVAGATPPLAVEDFESARARGDVAILEATWSNLRESSVAGPALFTGGIVCVRGDVAMGLLGVAGSQPAQGAGEDRISGGGYCSV